jgi:hypothetical protein
MIERPEIRVDVIEKGTRPRRGWEQCVIGEQLRFKTAGLESYCFMPWQPVVYDMLLLAAAVEYCDRRRRRFVGIWTREIALRLPVHEPDRWNAKTAISGLTGALSLLTGDIWQLIFLPRRRPADEPRQSQFSLPDGQCTIVPFSDGMDSRSVAGLLTVEKGDRLIHVRVGSKRSDRPHGLKRKRPFASLPYQVQAGEQPFYESSARSRGFKFALISGVAAFLVGTSDIAVPESGQGALGPVLVPVGQTYEDYRNHPQFTARMEQFIQALLGHHVEYRFPRLWSTKGETLRAYANATRGATNWGATRSCWQQNRHASVNAHLRQCGVCAACMLRRLSVHAAGLSENPETYVWENLSATRFEAGTATGFTRITKAMREYAIAGTLHLDHLSGLRRSPVHARSLKRHALNLSQALGISRSEAEAGLNRLLEQHETEWSAFMRSLGPDSFVSGWTWAA